MHSLALKMTLRIWGATTLVFLAIIGIEYSLDKRQVVDEVHSSMRLIAGGVADGIGAGFRRMAEVPAAVAAFLEAQPAVPAAELRRYLARLLGQHPDAFGMAVAFAPPAKRFAPYYFREQRRIRYRDLAAGRYDYIARSWYRDVMESGTAQWTAPYFDAGGGDALMITHVVPFRRGGRLAGVATVDVALATLSRLISRVRIGDMGYGFLVAGDGTLVSFPDAARVMRPLAQGSPELARQLRAGALEAIDARDPLSGEPAWVVPRPVPRTRLTLAVVYPKAEAMRRVLALNRITGVVLLAGLGGLLIVVALASRAVARPVARLAAAAREVATGNLALQLPEPRSRDEVGVLAASFRTMVADLRAHIAELQRTTAEHERLASELRIAHEIQLSILPRSFPPFPDNDRFAIYACAQPAREMGGDFYDFLLVDETHLGLAIADVSDKGVPAALYMAVSRTLLRATALQGLCAGECLARVNDLLAAENDSCMFVTLFYAILDTESGALEYANGGHNPPLWLRAGGSAPLAGPGGLALGIEPGASYPTHRVQLAAGDALFLYTDGITEATDPGQRLFGEERLVATLAAAERGAPQRLVEQVLARVREHQRQAPQFDDITALSVAFFGPGLAGGGPAAGGAARRPPALALVLRNELDEITRAQALVEEQARAHGLDDRGINALSVALDEVLTNIISYGFEDGQQHAIELRLELAAEGVRIEIADDGKPFNPLEKATPDTDASVEERPIGGLGIHLVLKLMDEVSYRRDAGRNVLALRYETRK